MTCFKRDAGATESEPRPTTPEVPVMGFIWQEEIMKDRKKREWRAFYAGCIIGTLICAFSVIFLMELTGGCK